MSIEDTPRSKFGLLERAEEYVLAYNRCALRRSRFETFKRGV
jgi:hypothetical protein